VGAPCTCTWPACRRHSLGALGLVDHALALHPLI
jgi:hypothetical protein